MSENRKTEKSTFNKADQTGKMVYSSPILRARKDENDEEFSKRMKTEGYSNLEQVGLHRGKSDPLSVHVGKTSDDCVYCKRKDAKLVKQKQALNPKANKVVDESSIVKLISQTPPKTQGVLQIGYIFNDLHLTLVHQHAGIELMTLIYRWSLTLPVKCKIAVKQEATFKAPQHPDAKVFETESPVKSSVTKVLTKLAMREFVPHVTDTSAKLKIGDTLEGVISIEILYMPVASKSNPTGYAEYLGIKLKKAEAKIIPTVETPKLDASKPEVGSAEPVKQPVKDENVSK